MAESGAQGRWRPEPWWLMLSLLGVVAGAVVGAASLVAFVSVEALWFGVDDVGAADVTLIAALAGIYGAQLGAVCGLADGAVLAFLVGRDVPGRAARRRAAAGAFVTTALVLTGLLRVVLGGFTETFVWFVLVTGSVTSAVVAAWFHGRLPDRPRLADVHSS